MFECFANLKLRLDTTEGWVLTTQRFQYKIVHSYVYLEYDLL